MAKNRIAIVALAGLVLALSITNWATLRLARRFYADGHGVRLDPLGLRTHPFAAPVEPGQRRRVVAFGDSTLARWPLPRLPGYQLVNRGIGGQTSAQILERFAPHVRELAPEVVLLWFGVNDLKTVPLFPERRDLIVADCKRNLAAVMGAARKLGARVIVGTILPTGPVRLLRRAVWSDEVDRAIVEVNTFLREQAAREGAVVLDGFALLQTPDGKLRPELALDELHTNAAGYAILSQALARLLDKP